MKMKEITLHIGMHKTGSSAIQQMMADRRDELLQEGILYPESGTVPDLHGQHELAWSIRGKRGVSTLSSWDDLKHEIARSQAERVVISSEDFDGMTSDQISQVRQMIGPAHVLMYIRDKEAYIASAFSQFVKRGKWAGTRRAFRKRVDAKPDFDEVARMWRVHFDVEVVSYDDVKHDLGGDFLRRIGSRMKVPLPRVNVSPKPWQIELVLWVNRAEKLLPFAAHPLHRLRRKILRANQ